MTERDKGSETENSEDYDLSEEKEVAPEENLPGLPHPTPVDGGAPAP